MRNLWKQFQDTGSIERKPGKGQLRATTTRRLPFVDYKGDDRPCGLASQGFPDLNSIEHVRDALGRAIATHNPFSENHSGNENSVAE
ncbi:hypothetical protein TNCV_3800471 [Trichonephila clavipes]|nr:hypothetical protein TNCV_3800471 [Trichonephila clavipes]